MPSYKSAQISKSETRHPKLSVSPSVSHSLSSLFSPHPHPSLCPTLHKVHGKKKLKSRFYLLGYNGPQLVQIDGGAEVLLLGQMEVTHTNLTEVARVAGQQGGIR